jgi:hypothetical protein
VERCDILKIVRGLLVILGLAGCGKLLGLKPTEPFDAQKFDSLPTDAPTACALAPFTARTAYASPPGTDGLAVTDAVTTTAPAIVTFTSGGASGTVGLRTTIDGIGTTAVSGIVAMGYSHPVLSPEGDSLFLAQSGAIWRSGKIGTLSDWSMPQQLDVPPGAAPGVAFYDPGNGRLHMLVETGTGTFRDEHNLGTTWMAGTTYTATMLGPGGTIHDPALTPDGLDLVYVLSGTTSDDGIWGVTRDSVAATFTAARAVKLYAGAFASPYIVLGCQTLYAIDTTSGDVVVLRP